MRARVEAATGAEKQQEGKRSDLIQEGASRGGYRSREAASGKSPETLQEGRCS